MPIIGLPFDAFGAYLGARAEQMGIPFAPPTYPPSLVNYISSPTPPEAYAGKKILSIHGELDELVPYRFGREVIAGMATRAPGMDGKVEAWVQPDRGHVCTPEMVVKAADWFWYWGLSADK